MVPMWDKVIKKTTMSACASIIVSGREQEPTQGSFVDLRVEAGFMKSIPTPSLDSRPRPTYTPARVVPARPLPRFRDSVPYGSEWTRSGASARHPGSIFTAGRRGRSAHARRIRFFSVSAQL